MRSLLLIFISIVLASGPGLAGAVQNFDTIAHLAEHGGNLAAGQKYTHSHDHNHDSSHRHEHKSSNNDDSLKSGNTSDINFTALMPEKNQNKDSQGEDTNHSHRLVDNGNSCYYRIVSDISLNTPVSDKSIFCLENRIHKSDFLSRVFRPPIFS